MLQYQDPYAGNDPNKKTICKSSLDSGPIFRAT